MGEYLRKALSGEFVSTEELIAAFEELAIQKLTAFVEQTAINPNDTLHAEALILAAAIHDKLVSLKEMEADKTVPKGLKTLARETLGDAISAYMNTYVV
jgi:hypothetical protein